VLSCRDGVLTAVRETFFRVSQSRQIMHLPDLCNECGNCATFCVHAGKPYREKPRLYFAPADLAREGNNGFCLQTREEGWTLKRRHPGGESTLRMNRRTGELTFENDLLRVSIASSGFLVRAMDLKRQFPGELPLVEAAEMYVIARGVLASLPYLPWQREAG